MTRSLAVIVVTLGLPCRPAAATTCISTAYEQMDLRRVEVREAGRVVAPPPEAARPRIIDTPARDRGLVDRRLTPPRDVSRLAQRLGELRS